MNKRNVMIYEELKTLGDNTYRYWVISMANEYGENFHRRTTDTFEEALEYIKFLDWNSSQLPHRFKSQ